MSSPKALVVRKGAKATVKHATHGTVAKAKRKPFRAVTLLSVGGVIGAVSAWFAARKTAPTPAPAPQGPVAA